MHHRADQGAQRQVRSTKIALLASTHLTIINSARHGLISTMHAEPLQKVVSTTTLLTFLIRS